MDVDLTTIPGGEVGIGFTTGAGSDVKLKLDGKDTLVGTMVTKSGKIGVLPIRFKKIE